MTLDEYIEWGKSIGLSQKDVDKAFLEMIKINEQGPFMTWYKAQESKEKK